MSEQTDVDGLVAGLAERLSDEPAPIAPPAVTWQPVNRYDVAAGDITGTTVRDAGHEAERLVVRHAAALLDLAGADETLLERILDRLATRPVDDLRIDFAAASLRSLGDDCAAAAAGLRAHVGQETGPRRVGIRVPTLAAEDRERTVRTVTGMLDALAAEGDVPALVVTLTGVTAHQQVRAFAELLDAAEERAGLSAGRLGLEIEVGTATPTAKLVTSGGDRLTGVYLDLAGTAGRVGAIPGVHDRLVGQTLSPLLLAAAAAGATLGDLTLTGQSTDDDLATLWRRQVTTAGAGAQWGILTGRDSRPEHLPARLLSAFAGYRVHYQQVAALLGDSLGDSTALAGYLQRGLESGALTEAEIAEAGGPAAGELATLAGRTR